MIKFLLIFLCLMIPCSLPGDVPNCVTTGWGLSGFPGLTTSDIMPEGMLRLQGGITYSRISDGVSSVVLPFSATWGVYRDLEVGGSLPIYADDERDSALLGDLQVAGKYIYETARGGTALTICGRVSIPTGREGRDPGSELGLGVGTSTTFRLFRFSGFFEYVLNGGENPFEGDIFDYSAFSTGISSFTDRDLQMFLTLNGNTVGKLIGSFGVVYGFGNDIDLSAFLDAGLEGDPDFSIGVMVGWVFIP